MRGRPAAEHCGVAAGPYSGEVTGFHARRAVPHAVDPTMLSKQRARPEPLLDLIARDPRAKQLRPGDYPMRSRSQLTDDGLYRADFCGHWPH